MRVVGCEAQSKLFDVLHLRDGPNIGRVSLQDEGRQYHYALDPQGFDGANSPKSPRAYVVRVIQFPISKGKAVIVYFMASSGSICMDRIHPCKLFHWN